MTRKSAENRDIRETLTAELLKRKSATCKEILRANYGEWPLRGLDIVSDDHLDSKVSFIGTRKNISLMIRMEKSKRAEQDRKPPGLLDKLRIAKKECTHYRGRLYNNPTLIWVNPFYHIHYKTSTLTHERRHALQHLFKVQSTPVARNIFNKLKSYKEDGSCDPMSVLCAAVRVEPGTAEEKIEDFLDGMEVQARIEQLLACGYPGWPHMPLSKPELWAAMTNMGVAPPQSVQNKFNANPKYLAAKQAFVCPKDPVAQDMSVHIALSVNLLPSEKARRAFWFVALPLLYGDILQSFGDRLGYERMRMSNNDQMPYTILRPEYEKIFKQSFADEETSAAIARKASSLGPERLSRHLALCRKEQTTASNEIVRTKMSVIVEQLEMNLEKLTEPLRPGAEDKYFGVPSSDGPKRL